MGKYPRTLRICCASVGCICVLVVAWRRMLVRKGEKVWSPRDPEGAGLVCEDNGKA